MLKPNENYNSIFLLGPTAVGKTSLGVRLAYELGLEIISADSRQVYKGLDLGSGKDLAEYNYKGRDIPYHIIDVTDLSHEYNLFDYTKDFYKTFEDLQKRGKIPFTVGGTGMYLDAVIRGYELAEVPPNPDLREEMSHMMLEELGKRLLELKPDLHNKTDLALRPRVEKALEIAVYMNSDEYKANKEQLNQRPRVKPLVLGTTIDRSLLRENIKRRLDERFDQGMIEEVKNLHEKQGFSWERMERLGLEYRFISEFLEGKIASRKELEDALYTAICQFAKRQETWFRGMERKGVKINWLTKEADKDKKFNEALKLIKDNFKDL
ncbi:MAG: tRNA (adenosine(37)-N6)-dimethylallyltransferase MiaA [Treponema sp.]|uniref:tRNA (adenosine(37)-N6)-dimethylallyltransferase MiaA n=1 Tax=Treponema sp. TaxID=166 RepID=UPI00298E683E|nr:tRNA (adenosine(37)-N6)-dimethylallyltransferase MiaA [Treponema sp.]MCR5385736.1 tRNA (adenosine(37)-N6)-dimethylallyltransferase MiaA [Treponema sp.]